MSLIHILPLILSLVGIIIGFIVGKKISNRQYTHQAEAAFAKANKIIEDAKAEAEVIKKERILEAREQFLQLKNEHNNKVNEHNRRLQDKEDMVRKRELQIKQKESSFDKKNKEMDHLKEKLQHQTQLLQQQTNELSQKINAANEQLERIAEMSAEQAKKHLLDNLRMEVRSKALSVEQEIIDEARTNAGKEARKIIVQTIQRIASEQSIENAITTFPLESDDIKGQIIGREGRNIRAIEAATGVDLIIDDTPGAIVLSCFDPFRREIARISLQRLVSDGRIHPARIEEIVEKTTQQMEQHIREIGERTIVELGIHGIHKELIRLIGKMRFRSSYGQNLLTHSKEVANLCSIMAAEMGINPRKAKRAGILHDIGKVPDEASELSHAILGMKLCEKYGEAPAIINAVGAHHDEIEMEYLISPIVQACDAISGARPGARREIMQQYIQRIKDLENLAQNYTGVEKAFAIQAGRELRVIVEADKINDAKANEISFQIANQIQNEMTYPGQIKVTVIREKRSVHIAK